MLSISQKRPLLLYVRMEPDLECYRRSGSLSREVPQREPRFKSNSNHGERLQFNGGRLLGVLIDYSS